MSFFLHNIRRMSFAHWKSNLLIFVDMAVCTAIFFIMLQNYTLAKHSYDQNLTDTVCAERFVIHLYDPTKIAELYDAQTAIYDVALKVQRDILNSPDWVAYEDAEMVHFVYSRDGFPDAIPEEFMSTDITSDFNEKFLPGQGIFSTTYMTQNGLRVSKGRTFVDADFDVFDAPTPMIIGAKLSPYLNVGDVITSGENQAVVVGILEEDSFIVRSSSYDIDINKSFIFAGPFSNFGGATPEDRESARMASLLNNGVIVPLDKNLDVQDKINQITSKYGFYPLLVLPFNMDEVMDTTIVSEKNLLLLSVLAILTSSLAVLSVGTVLLRRTRKDIPNICVFLMSGIPLGKIMLSILIDLLFWGSLALLPSLVLSWTEYRAFFIPIWQLLLFHYGALFIAFIPIIPTLGRINLDYNIRAGGE